MQKKISRKAVLFVAVLVAIAQLFLTLAQNAGFSLAQTGTACSLNVSISSDTPVAQSVSFGQAGVTLVKFNLIPNCDIMLSSFAVSLLPMPNGFSNISSLRLYKDGTQLGSTLNNPSAGANFTNLNTPIPVGGTVFEVKGDISTSAIVGSTIYGVFGGSYATRISDSGWVDNNASGNIIAGNVMTISSSGSSSVPATPSEFMLNGTMTSTSIPLRWTDNANNEDRFSIHRKLSSASWSGFVPDSSNSFLISYANTTSYIDTTPTAGMTYDYRITACLTGVGCSDYAYLTVVTPASSSSLPQPPSSVSASSSAGKIVISWPASTSAVKYSIYRSANGAAYQIWNTNIVDLYFDDFSVTAGSSYKYKVKGCTMDDTICSTTETESNVVMYGGSADSVPAITPTPMPNTNTSTAPTPTPAITPAPASTPFPTPTSAIEQAKPNIATGIDFSVSSSTVSGTKNVWAKSDLPLTGLTFKFYNTVSGGFTEYIVIASPSTSITSNTVSGGFNYWSGVLDTAKLYNGSYKLIAKGVYNGYSYENNIYFYFNVNNSTTNIASSPFVSPVFSPIPAITSSPYSTFNPKISPYPGASPVENSAINYISAECQQKGYMTPEACQKYFQLPWECRSANILDGIKCQEYMFKLAMPEICREKGFTTQEECAKIILLNSLPQQCKDANITDEAGCKSLLNSSMFLTVECKEANISDFSACGNYMAEKFMPKECVDAGSKTKEECDYIMRSKYGNFAQETAIAAKIIYPAQEISGMPQECRDKGIADPMECGKYMTARYLPEDCKAANIATKEDCGKFLFEKNAPKECLDTKISDPKECENFIFKRNAPKDCIDAGMVSPEGCKKFMFEKYGNKENIPLDKFPVECQKAGVKSADECEKIMAKSYLPEDCKKNGISDSDQCGTYLKQKYMPQACLEAGAKTQKECDKIMFKKFAPEECKKAGIEDEKGCRDYMFNLYASKMTCQNLDEWQCKNTMKENHLGDIAAKQADYNKIKDGVVSLSGSGSSISAGEIKEKFGQNNKIVPFAASEINLKIINADEKVVLNKDENLVQTAPIIVAIDSDGDALPDDTEKRIGTDPNNRDTDNDGFFDGEEIKDGYNPLGAGNMTEEAKENISPVDWALIQNKTLGHPMVDGAESKELIVSAISDIKTDNAGAAPRGYELTGKGDKNSVMTIYIYSDMPVVATVKTDEFGNWQYELDKSLVDGEHEVYVAVNDNTGKVVNKSQPLSFFINEARAVSVSDFIALQSPVAPKESEKVISSYTIAALLAILAGIIIFIFIIIKRKKQAAA